MALSIQSEPVRIAAGKVEMDGALWLPPDHTGVVLFACGSDGNRVKPPSDYVASVLHSVRLGTLWLDLPGWPPAHSQHARAEASLLTQRLDAACDWLRRHSQTCDSPIGLFGAGNGAAAAMQLAALRGGDISALVLRGGCTGLVAPGLVARISAPTLLIVGSLDDGIIGMNRSTYAALRCKKHFDLIPGATHAFDEPGSVEVVARLTRGWFLQHAHFVLSQDAVETETCKSF